MSKTKVLMISGSLRKDSLNTALLRHIEKEMEGRFSFCSYDIGSLPHFNSDIVAEEVEVVESWKELVGSVQGVLVASPEYNYGIPGPLKNALDWASRPAYRSVFAKKPVGLLGVSASVVGTARVQSHLRQVFFGMNSYVFPFPEVLIGQAFSKFEEGKLVDSTTREVVKQYIEEWLLWVQRFQ